MSHPAAIHSLPAVSLRGHDPSPRTRQPFFTNAACSFRNVPGLDSDLPVSGVKELHQVDPCCQVTLCWLLIGLWAFGF